MSPCSQKKLSDIGVARFTHMYVDYTRESRGSSIYEVQFFGWFALGLLNLSKLAVNIFGVILLFAFHPKTWGSRLIFSDVICGSLSVAVCGSYSPMSSFRCRVFHFREWFEMRQSLVSPSPLLLLLRRRTLKIE